VKPAPPAWLKFDLAVARHGFMLRLLAQAHQLLLPKHELKAARGNTDDVPSQEVVMPSLKKMTALVLLTLAVVFGISRSASHAPDSGPSVAASLSPNMLFQNIKDLKSADQWDAF
jgi:hypothetical protein